MSARLTADMAASIAVAPVRIPKPLPDIPPRHFCPDCGWMPVPPPRSGKDGRCAHCRSQVGRRP